MRAHDKPNWVRSATIPCIVMILPRRRFQSERSRGCDLTVPRSRQKKREREIEKSLRPHRAVDKTMEISETKQCDLCGVHERAWHAHARSGWLRRKRDERETRRETKRRKDGRRQTREVASGGHHTHHAMIHPQGRPPDHQTGTKQSQEKRVDRPSQHEHAIITSFHAL